MTELEKMLASLPYDSRDPQLLALYLQARNWMQVINVSAFNQIEDRISAFEALLGAIGDDVWIEAPFYCDYGQFISVGSGTFIHMNCTFIDNNYITIGNNCLIGPSVQIYTSNHPLKASDRLAPNENGGMSYVSSSQAVTIEDQVWIGGGAIILPGVSIGAGSTIGAGSVVNKSIPEGVVAVGNPCKIVKTL